MFTGIIEDVCPVIALDFIHAPDAPRTQAAVLNIQTPYSDLTLGESVAINGVCLTVTEFNQGRSSFYISSETLTRTNLASLTSASHVNTERALLASQRLSGHIVQGHVDGIAKLNKIENIPNGSHQLEIQIPTELTKYCVEKGSITINGISLTINQMTNDRVSLMIIPHTWEKTQLQFAQVGDDLNIEVDVLAKYVERLCQPYNPKT